MRSRPVTRRETPPSCSLADPELLHHRLSPATTCETCINPAFAWNHGDIQREIANTCSGSAGPECAAKAKTAKPGPITRTCGQLSSRLAGLQDTLHPRRPGFLRRRSTITQYRSGCADLKHTLL